MWLEFGCRMTKANAGIRAVLSAAVLAVMAHAGPVEFGLAEVNRAITERGMNPANIRFRTEIGQDAPESFRIELVSGMGRISGGDLRGLMYGLLAAAEQIRLTGHLSPAKGSPATPIRGIRVFIHNRDLDESWYYSKDYWQEFFAMLARDRFNRFNLVFAHQTNYMAPPYPFWVAVEKFPQVRVPGLTDEQRNRNLEMLKYISQNAADHGIDFTLGIWEHNIQRGMTPMVEGLTTENIGPYSYEALKKVLAACPAIRSVQLRTNVESGIPNDRQVAFYRDWVFRALRDSGRRLTLDLRGWAMQRGMLEAAEHAGVPLRLSSKYWAEDLGRPYQPAETFPGYSYLNFLEKPRPYGFFWELWGLGSNRLLLWGDPDYVRRAVPTFELAGSSGFEIDPPLAQKGFGNRPGVWGVFTEAQQNRVFWRWEFERYWMFYMLWGRLSYDPKTPDKVWMAELQRRFGAAAADVLEAYRQSGNVLPQIVAAHLADPNMYIWPEINPGGLIDAYKDVRSSDWRTIASIREAVRDRLEGIASAKQTPQQTADLLNAAAAATEQAVARAKAKTSAFNKEWLSSEPDFLVLAALARYHAHKQLAAYNLTLFDKTADASALDAAKREVEAGIAVWENLVKLTDNLYPEQMAFGPDDIGDWKDKLPYVRHDLVLIKEREKILQRFGRFVAGFDFGGPVHKPRNPSYRNDPFVWDNTVEPRFTPINPDTKFDLANGYGWVEDGVREALALPLTPYAEVRATAKEPAQLPVNMLFGDSIRGRGAQTFRARTGNGEFTALLLDRHGKAEEQKLEAHDGYVDIRFPEGEWNISGVVIQSARAAPPPPIPSAPKFGPRPQMTHVPPASAAPDHALPLTIRVSPAANVRAIRLYYRAVNQLAKFKMLEASGPDATFTIPAEDISPRWDLLYYFEILNKQGGGWFQPDPAVETPYYVVKIEQAEAGVGNHE